MRALVTGCAGFIGYHLCLRLLEEGHDVVGVDNLSSGSADNAADLERRRGFRFVRTDITAPLPVEGRFDEVYNLACPASPVDFATRALEILDVCAHGVWRMLELARQSGARLLHTSTSEVYGDPQEHPQRETYWGHVNPVGPRSCYDEGKRFAEALIVAYRARYRTPIRTARIFNTYGPRMRADDGRALPTFISQALRGEPLTVHGDGSQTRSFCYVSDMVDGLVRLIRSDVEAPVNLGNPDEITVLDAAREVVRLCGSRSTIVHAPRAPDDPCVRRPDIARARTLLRWAPRIGREDGFARTVEWFREALRA